MDREPPQLPAGPPEARSQTRASAVQTAVNTPARFTGATTSVNISAQPHLT